VDEPAGDVEREKSERPQDQQDDGDGEKHVLVPVLNSERTRNRSKAGVFRR
jgi:hypothetical protein